MTAPDNKPKPAPKKKRKDRTGVKMALTADETTLAKSHKQQHGDWPPVLLTPDGDFRVVLEYGELKKIELEPR